MAFSTVFYEERSRESSRSPLYRPRSDDRRPFVCPLLRSLPKLPEVRCTPLFSSPHHASAIKSRTRLIDLSSPTEKLGPVRSLVGDALGDDCLPITDLRDFLCFCVVSCILLIILAKMTDRRRQEPRQPPNLPIDFLWFLRGILR